MNRGKVIIISAPSGCGKSTIIREIQKRGNARFCFSVSATNRSPRTGEIEGESYYFLSDEDFRKRVAKGDFLEYEEVYPGRFYGTLKSEVENKLSEGKNVLLDIDVKGGVNVSNQFGDEAISIFILPPSIEVLRQRLEGRGTDSAELIAQRIGKAEFELSFAPHYNFQVLNDDLQQAVDEVEKIIIEFTSDKKSNS